MSHKLSKTEKEILSKLGRINHGNRPGRPSNKRLALLAQIAAIDAYLTKKQIKDDSNGPT